jgi:serine protease Do
MTLLAQSLPIGRRAAAGVGFLVGLALLVGSAAAQSQSAPAPLWQEAAPRPVDPELARLNAALSRLAEELKPGLVQIRARRARGESEPDEGGRRSMGSGFLIHPDGYLVTNAHVVGSATSVQVRLSSGRRVQGQVIGRDPRVDLALVKVDVPEKLPVLALGDSDQIRVGELVVALGHPFGLEHSASFGIVSRKGPPLVAPAPNFDFIQTDAAVNPGNSGGPLVDMAGRVIGVNTMAAQRGSVGFAIPSNLVKGLLPLLVAKGRIDWGWLGVRIDEITEENATEYGLAAPRGVGIDGVMPGQPAEAAGLRAKDVILTVDGRAVATPKDLQQMIAGRQAGAAVRLGLLRGGQEQELAVVLGRFPEEDEPREPRPTPPTPR